MARALACLIVGVGAIAAAGVVSAAGPYDGQWNARTSFAQRKCVTAEFPVTVTDGRLSGVWKGIRGSYEVSGRIAPDGSFEGHLGKAPVRGKFSHDSFDGAFPSGDPGCGEGHVRFERVK